MGLVAKKFDKLRRNSEGFKKEFIIDGNEQKRALVQEVIAKYQEIGLYLPSMDEQLARAVESPTGIQRLRAEVDLQDWQGTLRRDVQRHLDLFMLSPVGKRVITRPTEAMCHKALRLYMKYQLEANGGIKDPADQKYLTASYYEIVSGLEEHPSGSTGASERDLVSALCNFLLTESG